MKRVLETACLGVACALPLCACGGKVNVENGSEEPTVDASIGTDGSPGADAGVDVDASLHDGPVVDQVTPPDGPTVCAPGVHLCTGKVLQVCNSAGTGYDPVQNCPYACLADQGVCQVCAPGALGCLDEKTLFVCSPDGLQQSAQPCSGLPYCLDGACVGCLTDAHCSGTWDPCKSGYCNSSHLCGTTPKPLGTSCSMGQCDVSGECCAVQSFAAQLKTLDIYIMADRSASMDNNGKWTSQSQALKSFFVAPDSAGMRAALRFFPLNDEWTPANPGCTGAAYSTPLVDWGELPGKASALGAAIDATSPTGAFTPTQEALSGLLQGAQARQALYPDHVVVGLIASDGAPCCGDCPVESAAGLGAIAAQYFQANPPIQTFAVYVDPKATDVMTEIAKSGGTGQAYDATGGPQQFLTALKAIQGKAIPCSVDFPQPDAGVLDPSTTSVAYTPGGSTTAVILDRVSGQGACGSLGGWYYDDPNMPTKVQFCPTTCTQLKNDKTGKIELYYGCGGLTP
ncbi:MAG: VWA domain-containing protein [Deltaproteobacteria bacterium]|nr:VWA domain-containing protein [Deltaproteobacteria bacterium]